MAARAQRLSASAPEPQSHCFIRGWPPYPLSLSSATPLLIPFFFHNTPRQYHSLVFHSQPSSSSHESYTTLLRPAYIFLPSPTSLRPRRSPVCYRPPPGLLSDSRLLQHERITFC